MKLPTLPKRLRLPTILLLAIITIVVLKQLIPSVPEPTKITEVLASNPPFLSQKSGNYTEHYTGEIESSNYTVYGENQGILEYTIINDPNLMEFFSLEDYFNKYQKPNLTLYGPWSEKSGYESYVFLEPGLIIVGHPIGKTVVEEWHIQPKLNSEIFFQKFSHKFSVTKKQPKQSH